MTIDWAFVVAIGPQMIGAARTTIEVTALSMALAAILGLPIAAAQLSSSRPWAWAATGYVEIVRGMPVLILVYWVFFVLPLIGVTLDAVFVGVGALGLYYSTYTAEIYRAGLAAVPRGQWEAANALNMGRMTTLYRIILPQTTPAIVPPLGNYLIEMFKATPLLATIGLPELLGAGQQLAADTFRYAEVYLWIGAIFLGLSYPSSLAVRWLERRLAPAGRMTSRVEWERPFT